MAGSRQRKRQQERQDMDALWSGLRGDGPATADRRTVRRVGAATPTGRTRDGERSPWWRGVIGSGPALFGPTWGPLAASRPRAVVY
jgi:hypothetical protein